MKSLYTFLQESFLLSESKLDSLKKKWQDKLNFSHDYQPRNNLIFDLNLPDNWQSKEYQNKFDHIDQNFNQYDDEYQKNKNNKDYWSEDKINKLKIIRRNIIDLIHNNDPHPRKSNTEWLLDKYHNGEFTSEDIEGPNSEIVSNLNLFERNKQNLLKKDINQYSSINELRYAIEPFTNKKYDIHEPKDLKKEAPLIYDNNGVKVYHIKSKEASCALGGSTWCTSKRIKSKNMFELKNSEGPFYIVHLENEEAPFRKIGIHPATGEFQDENNINIDYSNRLKEFIDRNSELLKTPLKDHIQSLLRFH